MSWSRSPLYRGVYLPLEPLQSLLLSRLEARRPMEKLDDRTDGTLANQKTMAAMCGVASRTWYRWAAQGRIPWDAADDVAVRLGRHPLSIWPEFNSCLDGREKVAG